MAEWQDGTCNEKSGFLFKHECFQFPSAMCQQCEKPICGDHAHELPEGTFCTSCARGKITSRDSAGQPRNQRDQSGSSSSLANSNYRDPYYHDPYLYGSSYYYGYHWGGYSSHTHRDSSSSSPPPLNDPADFTEADGETFEVERDENLENDQFEKDMGES